VGAAATSGSPALPDQRSRFWTWIRRSCSSSRRVCQRDSLLTAPSMVRIRAMSPT